jgi:hypothetical protein
MKLAFVFLIATLIILNYSCNENSTDSNYSDSLIPFKLNNSWEYLHFIYDTSGNVMDTYTATERIIKDTIISDIHFYKYDNSVRHLTSKQDGIWMYFISDTGVDESSLYYKFPCKTGDIYNVTIGRPPAVASVLSTNDNVTVESGTFNCILYRFDFDMNDSYHNIYISPGIGIIKYEHYQARTTGTVYKSTEERLLSYHLY